MKTAVLPMRDLSDLLRLEKYFIALDFRLYMFIRLSSNLPASCLEIQALKWQDVFMDDRYISFEKSSSRFIISSSLHNDLALMRRFYPDSFYVFPKQQAPLQIKAGTISYQSILTALRRAEKHLLFTSNSLGVTIFRKTYGYHCLMSGRYTVAQMIPYMGGGSSNYDQLFSTLHLTSQEIEYCRQRGVKTFSWGNENNIEDLSFNQEYRDFLATFDPPTPEED